MSNYSDDEEFSDDQSTLSSYEDYDNDDEEDDLSTIPPTKNKETREFSRLLKSTQQMNVLKCFERYDKTSQKKILKELHRLEKQDSTQPLLFRILMADVSDEIKNEMISKYQFAQHRDSKHLSWVENILRIPFGKYTPLPHINKRNFPSFLEKCKDHMESVVYGHRYAKDKILQYISQLLRNPESNGMVLGIKGPMGNGKTTLIEKGVSTLLERPFYSISLGGAYDSSYLNGHSFTYEGSTWGQIVDCLMKSQTMNPIIYMDELDKLSSTSKGYEIMNILIHITDPSQNDHFQDRYFGNINIDLSKVIFIFSYNDEDRISSILLDRIFQVDTRGFSVGDKLQIARHYLIPSICKDMKLNLSKVLFTDELLTFLIDTYTYEPGVRKLKEKLYDILRQYNYISLHRSLKLFNPSIEELQKNYLQHDRSILPEKIHKKSIVGKINGLYATSTGMGGIIPIEVIWKPSIDLFDTGATSTGNIGSIMTESISLCKTVAWNLLSTEKQKEWLTKWEKEKTKLHLHCENMGSMKEGPSACTALALCILSLLENKPISNHIAITGELNLQGDVLEVGGIHEKIYGAYRAGVQCIMYPKSNQKDVDQFYLEYPQLKEMDTLTLLPIDHIEDAIMHVFGNNKRPHSPSPSRRLGRKKNNKVVIL